MFLKKYNFNGKIANINILPDAAKTRKIIK